MQKNLDPNTMSNIKKVESIFKTGSLPNTENILKNFPYFYYNTELYPDFQEMLSKKFDLMNLDDDEKKRISENSPEESEKTLKEKIEGKIKSKYKLIIPAILIELAENGKDSIEFQKEDLKNIKHIEINGGIAYVLYEHYFSALLAYNVLNEIISADNRKSIAVKLFTKEEDEEKQKKSQDKHKKGGNKSLIENVYEKGKGEKEETNKGRSEIPTKDYFPSKAYGKSSGGNPGNKNEGQVKPLKFDEKLDFSIYDSQIMELPGPVRSSFSNVFKKEEKKAQSIFSNDIFSPKSVDAAKNMNISSVKENEQMDKNRSLISHSFLPLNNISNHSNHFPYTNKPHNNNDSLFLSALNTNDSFNLDNVGHNPTFYDYNQSLNNLSISMNMSYIPSAHSSLMNFKTLPNRMYLIKYVCNYNIQIENEPTFQVTRRLIGNKGAYLKKILYDTCIKYSDYTTKIRLRGKGSGYKEGPLMEESDDPLQLCVSSLNYFHYCKCCETIEIFLNQIYYEYFIFLFNQKQLVDACPKKISKYEYVINRY